MIKFALLGLLREQPDYGYRLKQRFEERVGTVWRLNAGQVYQTLRRLERAGLVVEVERPTDTGAADPCRPKRVFELTPKGTRALERWLQRPPVHSTPARDETLLKLLVLDPARRREAVAQIQKLTQVYTRRVALFLAHKRRLPTRSSGRLLVREVSLEAVLLHAEAHLRWLEYTLQRLQEGSEDQRQTEAR